MIFFNKNELEVLKRFKYGEEYKAENILSLKEAADMIAMLGDFKSSKNRVAGLDDFKLMYNTVSPL